MDYKIKKLDKSDYYIGFLQLLEQLTTVDADNISHEDFCKRLDDMNSDTFVIIHNNTVVSSGTIYIEKKFIHHLGAVGHIEDIVVDVKHRKKGLGKMMIDYLTEYAKNQKCYKVILNCAKKNIGFYEKCGYKQKEVEMVYLHK
uniref:Acetyltransferase (GNAT) family protein n=1 Tax=Mimivirus LCMiAC02 TaxID=2506609 RepID=A0A4D5XFU2_9VIRU|nr:MAG: acetyltransferase (GNAT) family protein [Mimivirus LCMiAC02]